MKWLVTNADDFGLDPAINAAVVQAHTAGILTSASLMVTTRHASEAIAFARAHPALGVGLHLCLVDGRSAVTDTALPSGAFSLSAKLCFSPQTKKAVEIEARAQIERFLETGLKPTHLDTHMHTHIHPRVLEIVARLAAEHDIRFIRAPTEPLRPSLRCQPGGRIRSLARWAIFGTLGARALRRLRHCGLQTADRTVGVLNPGQLTEEFLSRYLVRVPEGLTEVFFHPATETSPALAHCQRSFRHPEELQALCSPRLRETLETAGIRLTNFRELATREQLTA